MGNRVMLSTYKRNENLDHSSTDTHGSEHHKPFRVGRVESMMKAASVSQ